MDTHPNATTTDGFALRAQPLGVERWVDASGQPLANYGLEQMGAGYKLLFCFQHACPGCHTDGFPRLVKLVELTRGLNLAIAAVQTVFEDWEHNSFDAMLADQARYALPIPFGHDAGTGPAGAGSVLMQRYGNGGTPWFILIDPQGTVIHSHFRIDVEKTVTLLRRAQAKAPPSPAGSPDWGDVIRWANHGNPPPPRRVEKTEDEWRRTLPPDVFRITRQQGTEAAHSSAMCGLFEPGRYHCACCATPLFDADSKFKSRSGWPSFTAPVADGVVAYRMDESHGMRRIETTCQVCDAHLGHVFPDGPEPTGLRYCINALALKKADA